MEMPRPIIQGEVNHIGVRILLLDEVKKAVHLLDIEVIALAAHDRSAGDVYTAGNASAHERRAGGLGSLAPTRLKAASDQRATEEGELILLEEDHLCGGALSQDAGLANVGQLLIRERIRGMDMGPPSLVADIQAFEQLADARQAHCVQPGNHMPHAFQMPGTAQHAVEQRAVVQDLLHVGSRQVNVVVVRGKKRACARFLPAPSSRTDRPVGSG
jgi:hypothetical protein